MTTQKTSTQENAIRFWHVLEYLAPFDLRRALTESLCYFRLNEDCSARDFPWGNRALLDTLKLDRKKSYKYTIYFGAFKPEAAMTELRRLFGVAPPPFADPPSSITCFGSFSVGEDGYTLPDSLSLSALPWAIGHLGAGDLHAKLRDTHWTDLFNAYQSALSRLFFEDADLRERTRRPFDAGLLTELRATAARWTNWSPDLVALSYCAIDEDKNWKPSAPARNDAPAVKAKEQTTPTEDEVIEKVAPEQLEAEDDSQPVEGAILNSFYVGDLERVFRALGKSGVGVALDRYLNEQTPDRSDLLHTHNLEPWCAPGKLPPARWASDDTHYQSLMQQVAINIARHTLANCGLFSVNGPPGTGKTTMLRDLVAHILVERATQLVGIDVPAKAFNKIGQAALANGKSFPIHRPDHQLIGFEIIVASSNNGAVENVTREIPGAKALGGQYRGRVEYFPDVAKYCLRPDDEGAPPWGLVAAVLGNRRNLREFARKFWLDEDNQKTQESLLNEQPPRMTFRRHLFKNKCATSDKWKRARAEFRAARARVSELTVARQGWAEAVAALRTIPPRRREAEAQARAAELRHQEAAGELRAAVRLVGENEAARAAQNKDIESVERSKPHGLLYFVHALHKFHRVFAVKQVTDYEARMSRAQDELERIKEELKRSETARNLAQELLERRRVESAAAGNALRSVSDRHDQLTRVVEIGKQSLGREAFADDEWWAREERAIQLRAPWLDAELNCARAELFLAALRLHETFIETAHVPFRDNLSLWADMVTGKLKGSPEQVLALWQTFFLVVPVISTTFASVGRMFHELGREALGYLLVDEAGQATPQAAVGALWRTKRAIIVGDPLQIEPVVALEDPIINRIAEHFDLSEHWRPRSDQKGASVQTLADHVNPYGSFIGKDEDALWVGCPLRVHRRCANPMFDISNRIAYDGLMIKASDDGLTNGDLRLGQSRWISVGGSCQGKHWVPDQGQQVLAMLTEMIGGAQTLPKVFVISPFRNVAYKLSKLLEEQRRVWAPMGIEHWQVKSWLKQSIGTVHTFQGKEAPTVILVLGTDAESSGARQWAAGKPNILNVAATRAQQSLYVVGDERLWGRLPYFEEAGRLLRLFAI